MKIAIAQLNYHIGNFAYNTKKIIDQLQKAEKSGADLVIFAELAISGYPPRDFLEFDDFVERCLHWTELRKKRFSSVWKGSFESLNKQSEVKWKPDVRAWAKRLGRRRQSRG